MKWNKVLVILAISHVIIGCSSIDPGDYRYPCLGEMEGDNLMLESYQDYLKKHPSEDPVQYVHSMETQRGFKFLRQATPSEMQDAKMLPVNSLLYFYTAFRNTNTRDKHGKIISEQYPVIHTVLFYDAKGKMMPKQIYTWRKKQM